MLISNGVSLLLLFSTMFTSAIPNYNQSQPNGIYAISYNVINDTWYAWTYNHGYNEERQEMIYPSPLDYDFTFEGNEKLNYYKDLNAIWEEMHGDLLDYTIDLNWSVNMRISGRRANLGFIAYDNEGSEGFSSFSLVNSNNNVSNREYRQSVPLVDKQNNVNLFDNENDFYCIGFYVGNHNGNGIGLPNYNYSEYDLNLPYLLDVNNTNYVNEDFIKTEYLREQNIFFQNELKMVIDLKNENQELTNENETLKNEIIRLNNELENNVGRFIESAFNVVNSVMNIEILPYIKLWYIVGVPLVLSVVKFIIGWFR